MLKIQLGGKKRGGVKLEGLGSFFRLIDRRESSSNVEKGGKGGKTWKSSGGMPTDLDVTVSLGLPRREGRRRKKTGFQM